MMDVLRCRACA